MSPVRPGEKPVLNQVLTLNSSHHIQIPMEISSGSNGQKTGIEMMGMLILHSRNLPPHFNEIPVHSIQMAAVEGHEQWKFYHPSIAPPLRIGCNY
ncbi:hypothetical protein CEXT_235131 [Caerostris extrusa]|uniref:Uncharacterized protein n=1 Tax=Caerostris extrusa TaxID=172846 RepID=A0AAV4NKJ7_CAEEX|nr:hypothetical protein CEXT_235131 [Caerostris extrusa]